MFLQVQYIETGIHKERSEQAYLKFRFAIVIVVTGFSCSILPESLGSKSRFTIILTDFFAELLAMLM